MKIQIKILIKDYKTEKFKLLISTDCILVVVAIEKVTHKAVSENNSVQLKMHEVLLLLSLLLSLLLLWHVAWYRAGEGTLQLFYSRFILHLLCIFNVVHFKSWINLTREMLKESVA